MIAADQRLPGLARAAMDLEQGRGIDLEPPSAVLRDIGGRNRLDNPAALLGEAAEQQAARFLGARAARMFAHQIQRRACNSDRHAVHR